MAGLLEVLEETRGEFEGHSRPDLAARVAAATARVRRPATVVCVVGEFKQGKSTLVNALVEQPVCPTDDDLATCALTILHHRSELEVVVHRTDGGARVVETVDVASLPQYVSEHGNPDNARGVERADIGLAHPLLEQGLLLVDTPGAGGLNAGHARATLAFLPYADAVVFVTDANAELSASELAFLRDARSLCPVVIPVLAKCDLYPAWRAIATRDVDHLALAGVTSTLVPTMAALAQRASEPATGAVLDPEDGVATLRRLLMLRVADPARERASSRAVSEAQTALRELARALQEEAAALRSPEQAEQSRQALEAAVAQLEHLRGPAARWPQILSDRFTELGASVQHRYRTLIRELQRGVDDDVGESSTVESFEAIAAKLRDAIAADVESLFASLGDEVAGLHDELCELIQHELGEWFGPRVDVGDVVAATWGERSVMPDDASASWRKAAGDTGTAVRGAQSGIIMLGFLTQFLPGAAAALAVSLPITLALAVGFGGKQIMAARKRALAARRTQVRQSLRQYIDDVHLELGNRLAELLRVSQRDLRDAMTALLSELLRSSTDQVKRLQDAVKASSAEREARLGELSSVLERLGRLDGSLGASVVGSVVGEASAA